MTMSKDTELFKLPAGPAEICFDKNDFMKKTFSVDEFLQEHRNAATLETMRDDLGVYLKVLRSAMIELINEDYADFVNLSSNLIGLDQSINGIRLPLDSLKDEIFSVRTTLDETMQEMNNCLEQKRCLREHLKSMQSLTNARHSVKKLRKLITDQLSDDETLNPIILERAAMELIKLKYDLQFCQHHIANLERPVGLDRYDEIHIRDQLLQKIEKHFLKVLRTKNIEQLERCLRVYCTLGEYHTVEELFRKEIVGPYMHPIISEIALQNSPQGLSGIYKQVIQFFDDRMKQLLTLTQPNAISASTVNGFDFIINSFWVEVEYRLETHMASIFAPGNPDLFYQKYKCTITFLEKLEEIIKNDDQIKRLREHEQYKHFQTKWNLPVYFQIRFQEIGSVLETACSKSINQETLENSSANEFNLKPFTTGYACINKCWADGFYLPQIFIRFFKLTLQIYARLVTWIDKSVTVNEWTSVSSVTNTDKAKQFNRVDFLVILYLDTIKLIEKIPNIFNNIVDRVPTHLSKEHVLIEKCLNESRQMLEQRLTKIEEQWNKEMLNQTVGWAKQVADIPRLYRKTNRDAPSKPCNYVEQILKPAKTFCDKYKMKIASETIQQCLIYVFSHLNRQYYSSVNDVLTSVQKTEESLRRLKNLREKSGGSNQANQSNTGMSDDDKIRLQLHVDICAWTIEIEKLGVDRNSIDKLNDLIHLAEECTKIKTSEK